jgi:hypothetical protein
MGKHNKSTEQKAASQFITSFSEQLDLDDSYTLSLQKSASEPDDDFLARSSCLISTVKLAVELFSNKDRGFDLFRRPNTSELLNGQMPIDFLVNEGINEYRKHYIFLNSHR